MLPASPTSDSLDVTRTNCVYQRPKRAKRSSRFSGGSAADSPSHVPVAAAAGAADSTESIRKQPRRSRKAALSSDFVTESPVEEEPYSFSTADTMFAASGAGECSQMPDSGRLLTGLWQYY